MSSYISAISKAFGRGEGSLSIVIDDREEVHRAGGQLRGKVVVQTEKTFSGGQAELTLCGKEKSIRKRGPVDVCHRHEFFSHTTPLCDLRNVRVGETSLPFIIDLPADLPSSSMHRIGLGDVGFNIEYKLTARMGNVVKSVSVGIASAMLKCGDSSVLIHPTAHEVRSVKGSNLGSLILAANVRSTSIRKGEKMRISLSCRNDSLVTIQRVEAKVVELLNWGSKEGYKKSSINKDTLVKIEDVDLPGVRRENENKTKIVEANYRSVEEQNAVHAAMQNDLVSGLNEIEMVVPLRARDTYAGTLVDVRHYLKIKFITDSFGTQPSIKIPLKFGLPEEIRRFFVMDESALMEKETVAITQVLPSVNQPDLPLASAVPLVATTEGRHEPISEVYGRKPQDFDQVERQVEPNPSRNMYLKSAAVVAGQEDKSSGGDILSLRNLIPMMPSP